MVDFYETNDFFEIPNNTIKNNKAYINLSVKESILLPGTSILEAMVSIHAQTEWIIKEILFTLNRREFFYKEGMLYDSDGLYAHFDDSCRKSYIIWKDIEVGKLCSKELIFNYKYPIPRINTPASIEFEDKAFLDYFCMVQVVSGDRENS